MRCYACSRPTPPRQRYCSRCRFYVVGRKEQLKRRAAMREAYDPALDAYRDHWSGVPIIHDRVCSLEHASLDHSH